MKILIVRFSSIGDIVLTSPVVRCIHEQVPDAEIHYLTKDQFAGMLRSNPFIHRVHTIGKEKETDVFRALKKEQFDHVIDLHHNLRSARVKAILRKPSSVVKKLNVKKWLMVNLKVNKLPQIHIVDRYMQTLEFLGVKNDQKGLDFFIPKVDEVDVSSLGLVPNKYIALVIGAKYATKQLPMDMLAQLCKKINIPLVLLGGKEDAEKANAIEAELGGKVVNACGKFNLNQSASLLKQASKVIAHDTGLMHIASAFKKDIISVWGNTVPDFGMYPYLPGKNSRMMQVNDLSCRPCSKIGYQACPKKHFKCMRFQNLDAIVQAAASI